MSPSDVAVRDTDVPSASRRIVNDLPPSASPRLRVNQSVSNRLPEG